MTAYDQFFKTMDMRLQDVSRQMQQALAQLTVESAKPRKVSPLSALDVDDVEIQEVEEEGSGHLMAVDRHRVKVSKEASKNGTGTHHFQDPERRQGGACQSAPPPGWGVGQGTMTLLTTSQTDT